MLVLCIIVTCFIYTSYHVYAFSGTNLLTRCHSASSLFSAVFGFRKVLLQIFSELHETKGQVPIFPTRTRSPKERRRRATRWPNHLAARQWAQPRERVVWRLWASPWLALLAPCVPRKNRRFGFCFAEFREYCPNSFSGTKNSRKQELALWHLVNRLVPENV